MRYSSATRKEIIEMLRVELHIHRHHRYWYHVKKTKAIRPLCNDSERCIHVLNKTGNTV